MCVYHDRVFAAGHKAEPACGRAPEVDLAWTIPGCFAVTWRHHEAGVLLAGGARYVAAQI